MLTVSRFSLLCKDSDVLKLDHPVFVMNLGAEFCMRRCFSFGREKLCLAELLGK